MIATTVTADRIREFTERVLERVGMPRDDARIVADALAWADLRGITAQGIAKLPLIARRINAGGTRADARLSVRAEAPSFVVLAGHQVWGHVAGVRGMRMAVRKARETGIGVASVGNTDSASAMGYYAELAAREGLIGLAINNGTPLMPPPGGTTRVLGNQAFAIAVPAGRHPPLLFDSALSAISWTHIEELRERGEPLAEGLALAMTGRPTTDHSEAIAGMLLPIGGHKGFGLALVWEVLTGVLSGSDRFASRITPLAQLDKPQGVAHFYLAIDPTVVMPLDEFTARVDALIDHVHASPPADEGARVFVPGEQGYAIVARREHDGIAISAGHAVELEALGRELGVAW